MKKRSFAYLTIIVATIGLCSFRWSQWRPTHPDRTYPMTVLTQNMQTQCVGRLLVDLPAATQWGVNASAATLGGLSLSVTRDVSRKQFNNVIEQRWKALQAMKKNGYGEDYIKPSERISLPEGGVVFAYQFEYIEAPDLQGRWAKRIYYEAEGYLWLDGIMVGVETVNNGKERIAAILPRIQRRQPTDIPGAPGICLDGVFIAGHYDLEEDEFVSWSFKLPRNMEATLMHTKVSASVHSFFERERDSRGFRGSWIASHSESGNVYEEHKFRWTKREVNGLSGEEAVTGSVEGAQGQRYAINIGGLWEYAGQGMPSPRPQIEVRIDIPVQRTDYVPSPTGGFPKAEDMPNGPTEAEFFEVWDAVIASIRFRPDALTPLPPSKPQSLHSPISRAQADADRRALDDFLASPPQFKLKE